MVAQGTTRDRLMRENYFDAQLRANDGALETFRGVIASADTTPQHRNQLRHTIYRRELEQLISRYSRGDSIEALRVVYPRVIDALADYQNNAGVEAQNFDHFDAYVLALWIMSLAVLLDVDEAEARRAAGELDNEGRDAVFDRLLALRGLRGEPTTALMLPKPYATLIAALDASGAEQTHLIRAFLDLWYDSMQPAYWHGSHRSADAGYFGYWCFELAAFVKALGIDDRAFADHPHYPRDLAHRNGGDAT